MSRHLTRALKALSQLGLLYGFVAFYYYCYHRCRPSRRWMSRQVKIRDISSPIWMRPGVSDWILMERIFLDKEYDPLSASHDAAMVKLGAAITARGKKPLIVDCGANIGLSAIWFARRYRDATVVAVEPEPENFALLSRNAENFPLIIPLHAAISDRTVRVALANPTAAPWAWQVRETAAGSTESVTVPGILAQYPDHEPFIIKIDIEGFETSLFRTNAEWVGRVPLMIFEPHDWMRPWSGTGDAFVKKLATEPRDYLIRGENMFAYSHRLLGPHASGQASQTERARA